MATSTTSRRARAALAALCIFAAVTLTGSPAAVAVPGWGPAFQPHAPYRLFDTRTDQPEGRVPRLYLRSTSGPNFVEVPVSTFIGVGAGRMAAVSLNVTVTEPTGYGFVTVYPCAQGQAANPPKSANLTFAPGQTVANAVIAPTGPSGWLCLYTSATAHLVVDINGWFSRDVNGVYGGDVFRPVTPGRIFDTRPEEEQGAVTIDQHAYGGTGDILKVKVTDALELEPTEKVSVVSLNVTVTQPSNYGFVTVYPCTDEVPKSTNLTYVPDQTIPNAVLAPVSASGEICFYSSADAHLIADINGWFPVGQSATSAALMQLEPFRLFDTRPGEEQGAVTIQQQFYGAAKVLKIGVAEVAAANYASSVGAVSLNVTVTQPSNYGFVTVYPCTEAVPGAANLTYVPGQTIPNAVLAPVSASGEICFFTSADAHLIADINGWFWNG